MNYKHIFSALSFVFLFIVNPANLSAQTKQEVKVIEKAHQVYDHGKIFKKAKRIALPGINLRFKLASRQTISDGSWKTQDQVKFSSWAMLNGLEEADFQEITDEFEAMWKTKLERMGLEVMAPEEYADSKGYAKLIDKNSKDRVTVKKNWGVAQIFSAGNRPFFVYPMSPLGPHAKFAKETDALITNMLVTIDFAFIGFEVDRYTSSGYKTAEGKSTIYPVIRLEGITQNELQVRTDGTYCNVIKDQTDSHCLTLRSEIHSDIEFAKTIESCSSCIPSFASKHWSTLGNVTGTYNVEADKALYKKAVLDALDKYTDRLLTLYNYQRL